MRLRRKWTSTAQFKSSTGEDFLLRVGKDNRIKGGCGAGDSEPRKRLERDYEQQMVLASVGFRGNGNRNCRLDSDDTDPGLRPQGVE